MGNSAEKRSVHTDALETLGSVIDDSARRDAIHIAVEPVTAVHMLYPGQSVGKVTGGYGTDSDKLVGIVDPFLKGPVSPGQRFWLLVYPRKITSLRHVWSHPEFEGAQALHPGAEQSRAWIENYASGLGVTYDEMIRHTDNHLEDGEYWNEGERFDGESVPDEFWNHFERATGKIVDEHKRYNFFSCSC